MAEITIAPFDLAARAAEAAGVMADAFGLDGWGAARRTEIIGRHARRPGLITRGALADDALAGFCYGFPSLPGSWWDEQVRPRLHAAGHVGWLDRAVFELTELHVRPDIQGRGVGRALVTEVLSATDLSHALLSVRAGDSRARRLYRSLGFIDLTTPFEFCGGPPAYTVMGVRLPLRRQRRRAGPPGG